MKAAGTSTLRRNMVKAATLFAVSGCARRGPAMNKESLMHPAISTEAVIAFLRNFDALADKKDFALIADMIHERAFFRFNDGDFIGRAAVQAVFEKTWKTSAGVTDERFFLSDIVVLTADTDSASATYTYNWQGERGGQPIRIRGRGTRVITRDSGRWQIIHEHLSRFPTN